MARRQAGKAKGTHSGWHAAVVIALSLAVAGPALALECPTPQALTKPGILKETPGQISALSQLLATGDTTNRIPEIIYDLRARYPGIENAEIVNYLMAVYCPIVAQLSGLSQQEQQARMDQFVSQLSQLVY